MKEFILIVEKDDILRSNIFDSLELEGYNVISAENGILGLQLAKEFQPDLILCEVDLPDFNGYEVVKKLREDLTTAQIPVIFLTSDPDDDTNLGSIPRSLCSSNVCGCPQIRATLQVNVGSVSQ